MSVNVQRFPARRPTGAVLQWSERSERNRKPHCYRALLHEGLQNQIRTLLILVEFEDPRRVDAKDLLDLVDTAVPPSNPDHFGRCPKDEAHLLKVIVLRDDREPRVARMDPNVSVLGLGHPEVANVRRIGKEVREGHDESRRQILIEEELQRLGRWYRHQPPFPVRRKG